VYQNILVPLDGSAAAEYSLLHTKAIARAFQVHKVFFIRVLTPFSSRVLSLVPAKKLDIVAQSSEAEGRRCLSEIVAALMKEGVNAEPVVVSGKPAEQVVDFAQRNTKGIVLT